MCETFSTVSTFMMLLYTRMCCHMTYQIGMVGESFSTFSTFVIFLSRVCQLMAFQVAGTIKTFSTFITSIRFIPCVQATMLAASNCHDQQNILHTPHIYDAFGLCLALCIFRTYGVLKPFPQSSHL